MRPKHNQHSQHNQHSVILLRELRLRPAGVGMELQTVDALEACKHWDGIAYSGQEQRRLQGLGLSDLRCDLNPTPGSMVRSNNDNRKNESSGCGPHLQEQLACR